MPKDWVNFPELRNSEFDIYYWESPHKQITENFRAKVVKVIDGDTVSLRWKERDFDFPLRMLGTNAPEMSESGGEESRSWLEGQILGEEIDIEIEQNNRVGKWGRLLGHIIHNGLNLGEISIMMGKATPFDDRNEGQIPTIEEVIGS